MKGLGNEWKTIGTCGKDKEDKIWSAFRATMDQYFDGLKQWNEQRHQEWVQRMHEIRQRKLDMIANQKRTIQRLQNSMVGLLSQREIDNVTEEIEDRKAFIVELEEEIADIDKKLA